MTYAGTQWTKGLLGASIGFAAVFGAAVSLGQVPPVPALDPAPAVEPAKDTVEPVKDAVEPAKDAVEPAKDAVKDATDTARDAVKDAKDTAQDAVKDARDTARDATQPAAGAVRDAARDARDTARDAREGVRDTARDAREGVRDTTRDARDTVRDARDAARDTARDARDTVRDIRGSVNASAGARANLRWQDLRSADVGLWFDRSVNDGLVIADVATQGPIAKLGFQEGDRIVSIGGRTIVRQADFMPYLYANASAGPVPVIINRGGKQVTIQMDPQVFLTHANSYESDRLEQIGLVLDDRAADRIVVWRVMPRSPAFFAGVRGGDVIVSFNKQPVSTSAELAQLAAKAESGPIALEVQRGDRARMLEVDFQAPGTEARSSLRPDYDAAPAAEATFRTAPASGYYDGGYRARRGLFGRRR